MDRREAGEFFRDVNLGDLVEIEHVSGLAFKTRKISQGYVGALEAPMSVALTRKDPINDPPITCFGYYHICLSDAESYRIVERWQGIRGD